MEKQELRYLTVEEMRKVDRAAEEVYGISNLILMENAGRGVAEEARKMLGKSKKCCVFCGKGNNGGDGFVSARHLLNYGIETKVFLMGRKEEVRGIAGTNLDILLKLGIPIKEIKETKDLDLVKSEVNSVELIIDALLGTGVKGEVRGLVKEVIEFLNQTGKPILSIDIPSGLNADTGNPCGLVIKATTTVTCFLPKKGFSSPAAAQYIGELQIADLGVPYKVLAEILGR